MSEIVMQLGVAADPRYRTVDEAEIVEQLLFAGWPFEVRAGGRAAAHREAGDALDRLVDRGLPVARSAEGRRRFAPAEVVNLLNWIGVRGGGGVWEKRHLPTAKRLVREFHPAGAPGDPPPPAALGPQDFTVTLRREFDLAGHAPGAPVRLRLPLPLEDEALRGLALGRLSASDPAAELAMAPGRLEARLKVPPDGIAALSCVASFTAYPTGPAAPAAPLAPAEATLYTRPAEGLIQASPRIGALAAELAGSLKDPEAVVHRFWAFVLERLIFGIVRYEALDPRRPLDGVVEHGWYDCQLASALLAALCRARGIPARLVSGYLLYPTCPSFHYWTEFWSDERGWLPLDTGCGALSAAGRDPFWRDYFFARLDYRMKTQSLPRLFTGMPTIRFPPAWHLLARLTDRGSEVGFYDAWSGALIYRDQLTVERVKAGPFGPATVTGPGPKS